MFRVIILLENDPIFSQFMLLDGVQQLSAEYFHAELCIHRAVDAVETAHALRYSYSSLFYLKRGRFPARSSLPAKSGLFPAIEFSNVTPERIRAR